MAQDKKVKTKYKLGRPREYDDEYIEKEVDALYAWLNDNDDIYLKEFAFIRGYSPTNLGRFAERNEAFRRALQTAHEWQEHRLAKGGITREFDPGFTKFVLARNHGWVDEKTLNVNAKGPIADLIIESDGRTKNLVREKDGKFATRPPLED